jgi:septal ring factor EnvC (AmiA/AmiB activator)
LAVELEQEEEYLTNTLQKQLAAVRRDKENVQNEVSELKRQLEHMKFDRERVARQCEAEEEFMSNSFMKKLREVQCEKNELETRLWEKRNTSRPSSLSQSRSSSFSIGEVSCQSGCSDSHIAKEAAVAMNAPSTDSDDHTVVGGHLPSMHSFHFGHSATMSAPSSLFSTPRDY